MDQYQEFIFKRSYARYVSETGERETWEEAVERYARFMGSRVPISNALYAEFVDAWRALERREIMPSMRALWSAGPALDNDNIAGYNCAYTVVDRIKSFAEILYILMNGAGVGFSVERQYINQLPEVPRITDFSSPEYIKVEVEDSKYGWADAYHVYLRHLFSGCLYDVDYSAVRPKGAVLKTFGGRASGPEPLKELFEFTYNILKGAEGRKLNSIEVYDIVCKIANCVVSGGVRRSATISLSNLSDPRMRDAKQGQFWITHPDRMLSNNSVVYTEKPDMKIFMEEWMSLMKSGTGERGIVNREALKTASPRRPASDAQYGVNPCGEIALRPRQFCNLTEVIVRPGDNVGTLADKVRYATILGVIQSTLTAFQFLDPEWQENCIEERLLGVSLTGVMDNPLLNGSTTMGKYVLHTLRETALGTAQRWSEALGIKMPSAITCVKPSGTVSQLTNTSSGLHPRFSPFYIRRVRVAATDPVAKYLKARGVPCHPETGQTMEEASTYVFEFPIKSPKGSVFNADVTALEQLLQWKMFKTYWCEHNPSVTIYVKEHEWMEVGAWVYRNWDDIGGLSFLPADGGYYPLAPYEEISEEKYEELAAALPELRWGSLKEYEHEDTTIGASEYACTGGNCEV